jgi:hypothetical protein
MMRMKLGRNEQCHCGSGKKFKKCHGAPVNGERRPSMFIPSREDHSSAPPSSYLSTGMKLLRERQVLFSEGVVTSEIMFQHGLALQSRLGLLLSDHSPIFWLLIQRSRQLRYIGRPEANQELLIRWQLATLFWIYGDHSKADFTITESGAFRTVRDRNAEERFYGEISALADEIVNVPSAFRRLSKGAEFSLGSDGSLLTRLPEALERAAGLYDKRRSQSGSHLEEKGLAIPTPRSRGTWSIAARFNPDGSFEQEEGLFVRFYEENSLGGVSYSVGGFDGFDEPNFMRSALNLSGWSAYIGCFANELQQKWSLSLSELYQSIGVLDAIVLENLRGQAGVNAHTLGLVVFSNEEFRRSIESRFAASFGNRASDIFARFCKLFEYDPEDLKDFDFFASHSSAVVLPVGDKVFLDVSQISAKIEQILANLPIDERMQHEKGAAFERVVSDFIRKCAINGVSFPIADSQELFYKGANVPFAEADVYVAKGDTLFLIDCKACGVSRRYLKGEALDVRRRWHKVLTWLAESDARAAKVALHPTGANYAIAVPAFDAGQRGHSSAAWTAPY